MEQEKINYNKNHFVWWWAMGLFHLAIFGLVFTTIAFVIQETLPTTSNPGIMFMGVVSYLLIFFVGLPLVFGFIHWKVVENFVRYELSKRKKKKSV